MTFTVFKLLFSNFFSFGDFWSNFKKGPKGIIKNLLIILLAIYCFVVFVGMFSMIMLNVYEAVSGTGRTYLMPVIGLIIALMLTFLFGIVSVSTNYYTGTGEEQLLSMPLKTKEIFGAKFGVSVVTDSIFGSMMILISSIIYGVKEGCYTNPLFYIGIIVSIITICVFAVFVLYLVFILLLTIIPVLRKKNFMQGIATTIVIIVSGAMGFLGSISGNVMAGNPAYEDKDVAAPIINSWMGQLGESKVMQIFANCLIGDWKSILVMAAVCAIIVFVFVPLFSTLYVNSLNGFGDVKTKKMNTEQVEKVLKESTKTKSIFYALFWRDVKTVLREPAFFANGPLMVFLMPVFMLIPACISIFNINGVAMEDFAVNIISLFENSEPDFVAQINYIIALTFGLFTIFTGNSSSIAATCFSREGKGLGNLKAMPVTNKSIVLAKFAHAYVYCILANVVFIIAFAIILPILKLGLILPLMIKPIILGTILSLAASLFIVFLEMFLDTANPKLNWENPVAAFKKNVNAVISVFGTIAVIAIFGFAGFLLLPKNMIGYSMLVGIFVVLSAPTGYLYFKYAVKRVSSM